MPTLAEVPIGEVDAVCLAVLARIDMSVAERASTWEQLRYAELRGKGSHGIARIPWMMGRLAGRGNGTLAPATRLNLAPVPLAPGLFFARRSRPT